MKPFNLDAAKRGDRVCTRDGRRVRIICWDCKRRDPPGPLIVLIDKNGDESVSAFPRTGMYYPNSEDPSDLMMFEEKKIVYTVFFRYGTDEKVFAESFEDKEEADRRITFLKGWFIKMIEVEI